MPPPVPCSIVLIPGGNLGDGLIGFSEAFVLSPGCFVDGLLDFPLSFRVIMPLAGDQV
jgi:hypothetical protein